MEEDEENYSSFGNHDSNLNAILNGGGVTNRSINSTVLCSERSMNPL
jgi:predicted transcriptional regulator